MVTAEAVDGNVKLTSKKEGSATVTATADGYSDAKISVTVGADGEIKTEVTQKFEPAGDPNFPSKTNSDTANNETTLGLVGTDTDSSNPSVATASIEDNKIVITSHSIGTAVITVKDGDKEATIEVTIGGTGKITIGKITEYVNTADIFTIENGALNLVADSYAYYLSKANLEDTTGNNAWSTASAEALANTTDKAGKTTFTEKTPSSICQVPIGTSRSK